MKPGRLAANPYTSRLGIQSPEEFFGRSQELEQIYDRLQGPQGIWMIGERRIGKSSILNALIFERDQFEFPSNFDFVLLDMQAIAGCTEEEFLEFMLDQMARVSGLSGSGSEKPLMRSIQTIAEDLQNRNRQLVVMFDEFDVLVNNEEISINLFAHLRALAKQVRLVIVTRDGSIRRLAEDDKVGSSFLNIFVPIYIGPFQESDALELIRIPAQNRGVTFTETEEELVLDLAGFFPLFLQIACDYLFSIKQSEVPEEKQELILEKQFSFEARPHLEYMFSRLPDTEQEELTFWIQNEYTRNEKARSELEAKGILIGTHGRTRIFSKLFVDIVVSQAAVR